MRTVIRYYCIKGIIQSDGIIDPPRRINRRIIFYYFPRISRDFITVAGYVQRTRRRVLEDRNFETGGPDEVVI